ncbi:molecular chaperone, partial [Coemansia guatemalensis]
PPQYRLCGYTTVSGQTGGTSRATKTCWNCQRETSQSGVLCDNDQCAAIQPVGKESTYYDVLAGGRATFDVDTAQLRRNFLRLQQAVHPDSFSQRQDIERKLAEAQSSWINHAYSTLKDPLLRAHYLLGLHGRGIDEEDMAADPELLMEVMELREEIEGAKTEPQIASLRQANDGRISNVVEELSRAFGTGALDSARQLTNKLQYLRRVAQAIQRWEPGKPVVIAH